MKETIKTIICAILIATLLSALLIVPILACANFEDSFHVRKEKVQVIEANDGEYAVIDGQGDVWEFTSDRTYFEGEILVVKFDTLGTESIYDDVIIAIKK